MLRSSLSPAVADGTVQIRCNICTRTWVSLLRFLPISVTVSPINALTWRTAHRSARTSARPKYRPCEAARLRLVLVVWCADCSAACGDAHPRLNACDLRVRIVFVPARRHDLAEAELEARVICIDRNEARKHVTKIGHRRVHGGTHRSCTGRPTRRRALGRHRSSLSRL
jgi:hypothetical protein